MQRAFVWLRSAVAALTTRRVTHALSIVALLLLLTSTAAGLAVTVGHVGASKAPTPHTAVALAPRPPAVAPALPMALNAAQTPRPALHRVAGAHAGVLGLASASATTTTRGATPAKQPAPGSPPGAKTSDKQPPRPGAAPAITSKQAVQRGRYANATLSGTALILDSTVTGGDSSLEAQAAEALGLNVEVDDATAWAAKATTDFAGYREIIFGDPSCTYGPDPALAPAEANPGVWGPAVTGNVVVIGTDPVFHSSEQAGAVQLIADGIYFAALDTGHTGAYIDLSCYYDSGAGGATGPDVPLLDAISTPGSFQVAGETNCPNGTHIVASSPALTDLSDAALANWSCSTHESFTSWPANYQVLAINTDMTPNYTAPDGISGSPYILAASSVTPQPLLSGAQPGPETGGNDNLAEHNTRNCDCDPIDTLSGNFSRTFTDFSIPGRGVGLQFTRTYNALAAAQNGPLGYGWVDSLGANLSVDGLSGAVTVTQENGSAVVFNPDGSGGYTAPSRVLATLAQNGDGSYTFTRTQDQTHFTFNASGQLISESDRNGYATTYAYNGSGQLTTVTDASGRALTLTYDGAGHIATVTDPLSQSVSFTYDGSGNLETATDVNGGHWTFTYDSNHLLLTMTDPRGGVTTNIYDGSGRVIQQTDPMGRSTTFTYTSGAGTASSTSIRDPNGNITVDQYDNYVLVSETKGYGTPQAATWTYTYDLLTLGQESETDPNGDTWKNTWDPNGDLVRAADPLGDVTFFTYDALNDITSTTDPLGVTTTYTYDANGNLLSSSQPLTLTGENAITSYTYGDATHPGDVTAMTDPDGAVTTYSYDANGDRVSSVDPLRDKTTDTYNVLGWKLTETSPRGNVAGATASDYTTTFTYDSFGDVTRLTDPLGGVTTRQYDANRNLIQNTDANGNVTKYTYDLDNELTKTLHADGSSETTGYDADGNQINQIDGNGQTTQYAYDPLNRLISTTDPLNRTTSYGYDGAGNRTSMTDAAGNVTDYYYDAANELVNITYTNPNTPWVSYTYDADGQREEMSDGSGTTFYSYDSLHRLTFTSDGNNQAVSYGYDLKGQLTSLTYPNGQTVTRGYDAAGRLTSVTDWNGATSRFAYDADGDPIRETAANGVLTSIGYDDADRISSISYSKTSSAGSAPPTPMSISYNRDAMGQVTAQKAVGLPEQDQLYTYSPLNQVSSVNAAPYTYDGAGDLTQSVTNGVGDTLSYDKANEVTGDTEATGGSQSYSYDALGDRVSASASSGATTTYTYDQASRLIGYNATAGANATSATYTYNGDGLRMAQSVDGSAFSDFVWQTNGALPLLLQDGATAFIYGPNDLPLEQINGDGSTLYFAQDQLGSTILLTDSHAAVVATYAYDVYGATILHIGSASTPLQYAGQYVDAESGLIYLRARYYDPVTSQFLTRDPLESMTKLPYGYVSGNPLNSVDVTGKFITVLIGAVVGAVVSAGTDIAFQELAHPGQIRWGEVALQAGSGAIVGGLAGLCGPLCAGLASADVYGLTQMVNNEPVSLPDLLFHLAAGAAMSKFVDAAAASGGWDTFVDAADSGLEQGLRLAAVDAGKDFVSAMDDPSAWGDALWERFHSASTCPE